MARWERRGRELESEECKLHETMDADCRRVLEGKKLLLFQELLEEAEFPGASDLVWYMANGFPLSGVFPETGIFPKIEKASADDVDEVLSDHARGNAAVLATCTSSGDLAHDDEL